MWNIVNTIIVIEIILIGIVIYEIIQYIKGRKRVKELQKEIEELREQRYLRRGY
jgi:uncharacterized membrane protein (DUF106 family)